MNKTQNNSNFEVKIENKIIIPWKKYKAGLKFELNPHNYTPEKTTVWSFPNRGNWASHTPQYRGNWSPLVVRNIIEKYSNPGDLVLDPMVGGGTTPVECLLLGRNSISMDINPDAITITNDRINIPKEYLINLPKTTHELSLGDTRHLDSIKDNSIDLITAHPPYANMIQYTNHIPEDLSSIDDYDSFFFEYQKAISEYKRVLKPGKKCAVLIGDTHKNGYYIPLSTKIMIDFLRLGFVLKEEIIKIEWNCNSQQYTNKYSNLNFLLTKHEHLFIFEKPKYPENIFKYSSIELFEKE